jgi:hypothetical protein
MVGNGSAIDDVFVAGDVGSAVRDQKGDKFRHFLGLPGRPSGMRTDRCAILAFATQRLVPVWNCSVAMAKLYCERALASPMAAWVCCNWAWLSSTMELRPS